MLKYRIKGRGIALLALFLFNMMLIGLNFAPFTQKQNDLSANGNSDQIGPFAHKDVSNPSPGQFEQVDSWWNESFRFRTEIKITEQGISARTNEPISVWFSFEPGLCSNNSIRIVKFASDTWTEVQSQVWNRTLTPDTYYLTSCTVTFVVSVSLSSSNLYFVYYTDNEVDNRTAYYLGLPGAVQTGFNGQSISLKNDNIQLSFANQSDAYSLNLTARPTADYFMKYSLGPSSTRPQSAPDAATATKFYTPNANGFIMNWLMIGAFYETTYSGQTNIAYRGDYRNWVDTGKSYVENDYPSNSTVTTPDYSKQWKVKSISSSNYWIDLSAVYGGENGYSCAYSLAYVYTPVQLSNIYIKICRDDGIRLYLNGQDIYYNNAPQGPTDTDLSAVGPINLNQGWNRLLVLVQQQLGNWGFKLRFSTDNVLRSYTLSTNTITNLTIAYAPVGFIETRGTTQNPITQIESGPVFSEFGYQISNTEDMKAWDNVTFYQGQNMFQVQRKIWLGNYRSSVAKNNSFAAFNAFIKDNGGFSTGRYLYDGNMAAIGTSIQPTNYALVYDYSGFDYNTATGVFLTNIIVNTPAVLNCSYLKWLTSYSATSGTFNLMAGNVTDFDNKGTLDWGNGDHQTRHIVVTFWAFLDQWYQSPPTTPAAKADLIYQSLMNPLNVEIFKADTELLFFNLGVQLHDLDGNPAIGVNVTLINATDGSNWDFDGQKSSVTTSTGLASFFFLKNGLYTINLTYVAYGHAPISVSQYSWGQDNVTVDTTKTVTYNAINLTTLSLHFLQYDDVSHELRGPISGGNVSFYLNNSVSAEKLGYMVTDESGYAKFYWTNYSTSDANITFALNFLDSVRQINITVDDFQFNLTVPMNNQTYTIGVFIGTFQTDLEVISSSLVNTKYWGDMLTATVNYTYTIGTGGTPIPIGGASVTYQLYTPARGNFNSSSFVETGTIGVYTFTFETNATWLDLKASESYLMLVLASKPGFTPAPASIPIDLLNITTSATPEFSSIQISWNENATIRCLYMDTLHGTPITGAMLSYQVPTLPYITGSLIAEGDGWYNFTVNSTEFTYADSYVISISASKDNYQNFQTTVNLRISKIKTYIGTWLAPNRQSITVQEILNVNVTTTLTMFFNYTDATGIGIPNAAVAEYEWEDPVGNKYSGFLADVGNGIYNLDFGTATKSLGKYSLVITIGQTNYVERVAVIALYIVEKPIIVTPVAFTQGQTVKQPQGEDITISVDLYDPVAGAPLVGATVDLFFDGEYRAMSPSTTTSGRYQITLPTGTYDALFAQIDFPSKIRVTMANYTQIGGEYLFTIAITPPQWFGIPQIYWIIIISSVSIVVVAFGIIKAVQHSRIPQFVRDIQRVRTTIRKNKSAGRESITESRGETISKALETRYAALGMSPSEKFAPKPSEEAGKTGGERKPEEEVA